MLKIENYFDNAATTPVDPRVMREMLPYFETQYGNANSLHAWGREAMAAVDKSRERVANLLGAYDPSQVYFTSGATEANNWVMRQRRSSAVSPFEHSSIYEFVRFRQQKWIVDEYQPTFLQHDGLKLVLEQADYALISVMAVNNEIGTIWEPGELSMSADLMHSDLTQALGKIPRQITLQSALDFASFSAHKFYGPKGVGGLYARGGHILLPLMVGGEQESGQRGGTLNVPGIVGMGAAAAIAQDEMQDNLAKAAELRAIVLEELGPCQDYQINGGDSVSPYILSVSFKDLEGETLVIEMDQAGYAISSGAACSSRSTDPSHVLTALKMPKEWLRGTIRISFGRFNTKEAAQGLGKALKQATERLRKLRTI